MNISASTLNTGTTQASTASGTSEISTLEKQKRSLQKEVQELSQSKEDEKTKEKKLAALNLQIQSVDAQIQQLKSEKTGQSEAGNASRPPQPPEAQVPVVAEQTAVGATQKTEGSLGTQLDLMV